MNKIIRFAALFCVLCMLIPAFAGCAGTAETTTAEQTSEEPAETEAPASAQLVTDGKIKCRIVRGEDASQSEVDFAVNLRKTLLNSYSGSEISIADDFTGMMEYNADDVEILIGKTKYPESQSVLDELKYGDAIIKTVGHKIVIASHLEVAYNTLSSRFSEQLNKMDTQNAVFTESNDVLVTINKALNTIPVLEGYNPTRIVAAGDKAYQLFYAGANSDMLDTYVNTLKSAGFETVSDKTVSGSRFTVSLSSDTAVTAYFEAPYSYLRIVTEPRSNYYETKEESITAVTTPKLTMIGRRHSTTETYLGLDAGAGLMCFIIRLSDGRFIVIDGGVQNELYSQAIYAKLLEQSVDKKPVIAAWILTHSHNDHIGGFYKFIQTYSSLVQIQSILYDFPSASDMTAVSDSGKALTDTVLALMSEKYPKTPVYKVHVGQTYYIADAKIEIYYAPESYVTKNRTIASATNNWNNSSIIFSVSIAGQKIMFLGDAQEDPNNMTAKIWGSYLKSDIVQVAHHGGIGGTNSIYNAVDPAVALFTTTDVLVPAYIEKWKYNYHLVAELHVKEYFNSCDRITTFDLPYTPKSSGFIKTTEN